MAKLTIESMKKEASYRGYTLTVVNYGSRRKYYIIDGFYTVCSSNTLQELKNKLDTSKYCGFYNCVAENFYNPDGSNSVRFTKSKLDAFSGTNEAYCAAPCHVLACLIKTSGGYNV